MYGAYSVQFPQMFMIDASVLLIVTPHPKTPPDTSVCTHVLMHVVSHTRHSGFVDDCTTISSWRNGRLACETGSQSCWCRIFLQKVVSDAQGSTTAVCVCSSLMLMIHVHALYTYENCIHL